VVGEQGVRQPRRRRLTGYRRGNREITAAIAKGRDARDLPDVCKPHSRAVPVVGAEKPVGEGRFARAADDSRGFRASPDLDRATLELGDALRRDMKLGQGGATDLLILGLSATDYVGHTYGTQGAEMCIQLMALDDALGDFFRKLDATGIDYLVMLTADHGGHDIPERHRDHAAPDAMRVDPALNSGNMAKALAAKLKLKGEVLYGDGAFGDMYVDRKLAPAQRTRVAAEAVRTYRAHPQVAAVFTKAEILASASPKGRRTGGRFWSGRRRASIRSARRFRGAAQAAGDSDLRHQPGYVSTHGSPWDYDRKVPILFWRKGMTPFEQSLAVETADIMPTLTALIGVPVTPGTIDGRCLDLDEGPGTTCK
jgi:hypothetical protein